MLFLSHAKCLQTLFPYCSYAYLLIAKYDEQPKCCLVDLGDLGACI